MAIALKQRVHKKIIMNIIISINHNFQRNSIMLCVISDKVRINFQKSAIIVTLQINEQSEWFTFQIAWED